jgi:hypothetical protein
MTAIAALVLPLALDDAKRASLTESKEQLEAVLLSARADAQRTGKTVRVAAFEQDGRWMLSEEEMADAAGASDSSTAGQVDGSAARTKSLQVMGIPDGVRIGLTREQAEGRPPGAAAAASGLEEAGAGEVPLFPDDEAGNAAEGTEVQIAMFLPDGQIAATRPLYIGGSDGRVGEISVNSWTGTVEMRVLPPRSSEVENEGEAGDTGDGTDIGGGAGQER